MVSLPDSLSGFVPPEARSGAERISSWGGGRRARSSKRVGPGFGRIEARARRVLRAAWDSAEPRLDHPFGRPVLRALSATALALQYRDRCHVRWSDGAWEYRWHDAVVLSDRALLVRARPAECGRSAGLTIRDDFLWDYVPARGDTVFDVGAGLGTELYMLAELVGPEGRVYAFEPHRPTFRILERLCEVNGWSHVEPIHAAVADRSGTVTISDDAKYETNDILRGGGGEQVPSLALDDFAAQRAIKRVDFIKMNIEGAEALAIRGMRDMAAQVRHLTIACHDFLADPAKATKTDVRNWLAHQGFKVRENPDSPILSIRDFLYASR
jgi:FkbM family methyltransferase